MIKGVVDMSARIDLTGKRYGKLVVVSESETNGYKKKTKWLCKCDCGKYKDIRADALKSKVNPTRSCGCLSPNGQDLTGMVFGRLKVIADSGVRKNQKKVYICLCDCGNETHVVAGALKSGGTKSCGCLKPIICSEVNRGKRHHNYNPNLTAQDRMDRRYILDNTDHKKWRKSVFEKDDYTCMCCGVKNKKGVGKTVKLNAHHLDGWNWAKDRRFDLDNGITLCKECHYDFHNIYGYGNNTKEQFEEYVGILTKGQI